MPFKSTLSFIFALVVLFLQSVNAGTLDNTASSVSFVSVKKEHIAEAHTFKSLSGSISKQGLASIVIDVASVDTAVGIRDDRMKEHLFNVAQFPSVVITANVNEILKALKIGETKRTSVAINVNMKGLAKDFKANVFVTKTQKSILVSSSKPIIISAKDFGMNKGVAKLGELVGGISIGTSVPVNFTLKFNQ